MAEQAEERHKPGATRAYRNDQIQVNWEPEYCIHSTMCWRNLPAVFRPQERPWVRPDEARPDEIARVIMMCPTGALSFERLDGGPQEPVSEETSVEPTPNGPLYVRGNIVIHDAAGNEVRTATRVALCRCGHSENKPFCDLSHIRVKFKAP